MHQYQHGASPENSFYDYKLLNRKSDDKRNDQLLNKGYQIWHAVKSWHGNLKNDDFANQGCQKICHHIFYLK